MPYGNSFILGTPSIDRMSAMLYQEQKQRELIRQKQAQQLDDEFAKNVAGIRDADVPELTKVYGDWKLANQQAMKNKDGIPPEQQLQLLRKKGEMYKTIAESKAKLAEEEDIRKGIQKEPDAYDDNASNLLMQRRRTPLSQLANPYKADDGKEYNLTDYNTYRYKGTNTDFQKILSTAAGTPRQVYQKEEPLDGNMQFKITPYLYGNTPAQFKESVLSSLAQHKAGRDAEGLISQVPQKVIDKIDQEFRAIPLETWKQMGVDAPQDLEIRNTDSKAERFATHQAQLYALNNLPKQGAPVFRDNKKAIDDQNFAQQKAMETIKHANAIDLIKFKKNIDPNDTQLNDLWVDKYITEVVENAKAKPDNRVEHTFGEKGKKVKGYKIEIDPVLEKALGFDSKNPGQLIITDDGKFIRSFYQTDDNFKPVKKDGKYISDAYKTNELTQDQVKLALGKKSVTPTQLTKEMKSNSSQPPKKKEIKRSTIASAAAAANYSTAEYEKMLKQNGVKIID